MKSHRNHTGTPGIPDVQNIDSLLAVVLLGLVIFFAVRPELSVIGEVLRIVIAMVTLGLALAASMSLKERTVFLINVFLALFFYSLFVVSYGVRVHELGDWFIEEIFEVTLFDVIITGLLGTGFSYVCMRVSSDMMSDNRI